ncbi:MAG: alpha-L-glutamate ligase-like protein [Planctomycetes bacterium]|nr:alpha-L-glutamate ligase-like protein [Planctomycetota bacterium]MBL7144544.1 alpha-L-glutamate ligase-like protein [Phycisphaerae bacterium]
MGINSRNINLIFPLNPRSHYAVVDNKALTKKLCESQLIPAPETYALIQHFGDIKKSIDLLFSLPGFVIKPTRGAGGRGVLAIANRKGDEFQNAKGELFPLEQIKYHISTILSGLYSLSGHPDQAMIEKLIKPHPAFNELTVAGTPDIRIVLYKTTPIMGMLRLPTKASRGRANLHQGAVGVGIDLETGITRGGVWRDRSFDIHPDTGAYIQGVVIPNWNNVLKTAMQLSRAIGLQYVGVDVLLDAEDGPLVLEANARPGLSIQIANRCGIRTRLNEINIKQGLSRLS